MSFPEEIAAFRAAHPDITTIEAFMVDLNGVQRGKLIPVEMLDKLAAGSMKMPVSAVAMDVFGMDAAEARIAIERGDPDGVLVAVPGSLRALPWTAEPTGQVQVQVSDLDGGPCPFDPRAVLTAVEVLATAFHPVMALELEFYLIDPDRAAPPVNPVAGGRLAGAQIYDMTATSAFAPIIRAIAEAAQALGAPADVAIAEFGPGQFEMNLGHVAGAVQAADHMVALKRAVRGIARAHGMDASFMPKLYGDMAGSGMHLHMSLLDGAGVNLFAGTDGPTEMARHAIAGLIGTMAETMLIFAPNANSYRRLAPGSYAPIVAAWGLDNRGAALRMPETSGKGARIEHRTAGADANPYLLAAAVLAGAMQGIEEGQAPPAPVTAEAGIGEGLPLPLAWWAAERQFAESPFVAKWMGPEFRRVFSALKRQELATMTTRIPDTDYAAYLRTF